MLPALVLVSALVVGCSHDCSWNARAQAFVDDNANGRWDHGELALSGVKLHVTDSRGNSGYGGEWESNRSGDAFVAFFVPCDEHKQFMLFATPPNGYVGTTPDHVIAGSQSGNIFTFGFVRDQ